MYRMFLASVVFVMLVCNGLISGLWADRWTIYPEAEVATAAAKVDRVPFTLGRWDGKNIVEDGKALPEEVVGRHIVRRYVDRTNGTAVVVFLTCGGTRPMWSGHQPLECYPGAGYKLVGSVKKCSLPPSTTPVPADFRVATFSMEDTSPAVHLRVFWSWSGDGSWQTPDYPHRTFAPYPFLYKLYVIRSMLKADEPLEEDPCKEFLRVFLPEVKKSLF